MTKRHFEAIASGFKNQIEALAHLPTNAGYTPTMREFALNVIKDSVAMFCNVAQDANPRFDRARFLAACGL